MGYGSGLESARVAQRDRALRWDLAADIVVDVWRTGSYVASVWHLERLADLGAAAQRAAQALGAVARFDVSNSLGAGPTVVVRISFVDPGGVALRRAQEGLASLLASVRRQQPSH